jgi:hypothetical protein
LNKLLVWFVRIWIGLVALINLTVILTALFTSGTIWAGISRVQDIYSPFTVSTYVINFLLVSPALGAQIWLRKRNRQALNTRKASDPMEAVADLGDLMQRFPCAILDSKLLPLPKDQMKEALKQAWLKARDEHIRNAVEVAFTSLCDFQEGVGEKPIERSLPPNCSPRQALAILEPYQALQEKISDEAAALLREFTAFKQVVWQVEERLTQNARTVS